MKCYIILINILMVNYFLNVLNISCVNIFFIIFFSNQMIASPSGPQLTPSGQMSGPIRSIGMF